MTRESLFTVRCRLSRSPFSSERVFRVTLADGSEHVGTAPMDYFFTDGGIPIASDQPAEKFVRIPGLLTARFLRRESDGRYLLSIPSGDVLQFQPSEVAAYPTEAERVSLQP